MGSEICRLICFIKFEKYFPASSRLPRKMMGKGFSNASSSCLVIFSPTPNSNTGGVYNKPIKKTYSWSP
jgi:hypothetical protein